MAKGRERLLIILSGLVVGAVAVVLVVFGNPANMGFCICLLYTSSSSPGAEGTDSSGSVAV